ncbi:MAG: hypothetical protein JST52_08720 [Bacteroidetes bacterium]|nr:hypothetical protein [Bacteroidota bacterium]MBS1740301.1 hypothetical protein [Bacteroidota bacterium]
MTKPSTITTWLTEPEKFSDNDRKEAAAIIKSYPFFVPARFIEAAEHHKKEAFAPAMMNMMLLYRGDWLLFHEYLQTAAGTIAAKPRTAFAPDIKGTQENINDFEDDFEDSDAYDDNDISFAEYPESGTAIDENKLSEEEAQLEEENEEPFSFIEKTENSQPNMVPSATETISTNDVNVSPSPTTPTHPTIESKIEPILSQESPLSTANPELEISAPIITPISTIEANIAETTPTLPIDQFDPTPIPETVVPTTPLTQTEEFVQSKVSDKIDEEKETPAVESNTLKPDLENANSTEGNTLEASTESASITEKSTSPKPIEKEQTSKDEIPLFYQNRKMDSWIQPIFSEDYFLHQGLHVSDKIPTEIDHHHDTKEKSLMVVMSFSEWLLHFKTKGEREKEEQEDQRALKTMWQKEKLAAALEEENEEIPETVFEMAVNSIAKEDDLASEPLAEILVKQGKHDKAIDMYRKLSLRNPQKKTYFARKIEDLQKEKDS